LKLTKFDIDHVAKNDYKKGSNKQIIYNSYCKHLAAMPARRHRSGAPRGAESSDDEGEEDAFLAMSRKRKKAKTGNRPDGTDNNPKQAASEGDEGKAAKNQSEVEEGEKKKLPVAVTSSNKRHHGVTSGSRKAKMDALLNELKAETPVISLAASKQSYVPDKKGSFVEPGEEHLTTNVFVGNLAPSITEEEMTDLFRTFGMSEFFWVSLFAAVDLPLNFCF